MRIRMLSDQRGAEDGFTLRDYKSGKEYDFDASSPRSLDLAHAFLREGWAEKVAAPVIALEPAPVPVVSFNELTESQLRKMAEAIAPAPTAPERVKPEPVPVLAESESTGAGGETPEAPRQPDALVTEVAPQDAGAVVPAAAPAAEVAPAPAAPAITPSAPAPTPNARPAKSNRGRR